MNKNQLKRLPLAIIFGATLLSLQACEDASASIDKEAKQEEVIKVPVEAETIVRSNIANYYAANAILESTAEADVISKVQGLVEQVYVEEGDYVKEGQLLAKLDATRYQLILQQRQAELEQVQSELKRLNTAKNKSFVSADTLEKLQWQFQSLQAATDIAKLDVSETKIVAPISGYISNRYVKKGNLVHQYQHQNLFHIVSQEALEGVIYLPEGRLPEVQHKQPVELSLPAIGNKTYTAHIDRINPVIDSNNGTFKVVFRVDNNDGNLRSGMFAEVNIQLGLHKDTLIAPSRAVISLDNTNYVYQIIDGKAVKTAITTGYRNNGLVEVVNGLEDNASLIVAGHNNLKNESEITIVAVQQ